MEDGQKLRVEVPHPRCPYCHDALRHGERPEVCADCHALHHPECWDQHGACAACGRTSTEVQPRPPRSRPRPTPKEARTRYLAARLGGIVFFAGMAKAMLQGGVEAGYVAAAIAVYLLVTAILTAVAPRANPKGD